MRSFEILLVKISLEVFELIEVAYLTEISPAHRTQNHAINCSLQTRLENFSFPHRIQRLTVFLLPFLYPSISCCFILVWLTLWCVAVLFVGGSQNQLLQLLYLLQHVEKLLAACSRTLFALPTLQHHGLPDDAIQVVFQAVVIPSLGLRMLHQHGGVSPVPRIEADLRRFSVDHHYLNRPTDQIQHHRF